MCLYLPDVQRLVSCELLQDEELVPHPAPPPPPPLGGDTSWGYSSVTSCCSPPSHLTEEDGVQSHGLTAGLRPQGEHTEHAQKPENVHVSGDRRQRGDVQTEPWVLSARLTFLSGCVRRTVSSSAAQTPETQFDLLIISVIIYNHWVRMCLSHMLHQSMISTAVSRRDEPADGQTDLPTTTTTYNIHNIRSNIIISN